MTLEDKINININQNIWLLIISYGSLGFSELYNLRVLFGFSFILWCYLLFQFVLH